MLWGVPVYIPFPENVEGYVSIDKYPAWEVFQESFNPTYEPLFVTKELMGQDDEVLIDAVKRLCEIY